MIFDRLNCKHEYSLNQWNMDTPTDVEIPAVTCIYICKNCGKERRIIYPKIAAPFLRTILNEGEKRREDYD